MKSAFKWLKHRQLRGTPAALELTVRLELLLLRNVRVKRSRPWSLTASAAKRESAKLSVKDAGVTGDLPRTARETAFVGATSRGFYVLEPVK